MTRYVTLIRFTHQGAHDIIKSTARAVAFTKAAENAGVAIESQLWTTGAYDGVIILKGEERKVLRCVSQLASLGNVRTETMRAFDAAEFKEITG